MVSQEEQEPQVASRSSLFPTSKASLDIDAHTSSSGLRKRKRDGGVIADLLDASFTVKPSPSTVFMKPRTLKSIALIRRRDFPLSCINTNSSTNPLPESRVFEAQVKILELEERMGNEPTLIIARLDDGKSLYAVERVSRGLYVLCRLGSWVDLGRLCEEAVVVREEALPDRKSAAVRAFVQSSADEFRIVTTAQSERYATKKRLAIEAIQSLVRKPTADTTSKPEPATSLLPVNPIDNEPVTQVEVHITEEPVLHESPARPVALDILESIRSQYLDTLYLSKAPLNYFAKGPLSRARTAFHLDYDSTLDMSDLVAFLDSLILPTVLLDKKYKDGVPAVVESLVNGEGSADEAGSGTGDRKKRKSKKIKIGKTGLYPNEDTLLRQWWESDEDDMDSSISKSSKEELVRKRVTQLRIRETQLQMIVILETLALQPLITSNNEGLNEDLPVGSLKDIASDKKPGGKGKPKKPRDLAGLIDVHVDRLCIWQSLATEEGRSSSGPGAEAGPQATSATPTAATRLASDVLREFCVEVIIPFFSARLPEKCGVISRKLGGPVAAPTPARPKLTKSTSLSGSLSRPGAITKRQVPLKSTRTLQRVLSEERNARSGSRGPAGAISLMRSATTPVIPGLKREGSETPSLSTVPSLESQNMFVSRGGVNESKKFSKREVDLTNMANKKDFKTKKADIEAELKEAITALKRPNRQLAGQLQVDTAEKRAAAAVSSRKSRKPIRNPLFQGVQILATPKMDRRKHVDNAGALPAIGLDLVHEEDELSQIIPASSLPRVPQSASRPAPRSNESFDVCKATPALPRTRTDSAAVQGTPCRPSSQVQYPRNLDSGYKGSGLRLAPSSPLQARNENKQQNLSVPGTLRRGIESFLTPTKPRSKIESTPIKQTSIGGLENEDPNKAPETPVLGQKVARKVETDSQSANDDSIYKSLGWDDYDDI